MKSFPQKVIKVGLSLLTLPSPSHTVNNSMLFFGKPKNNEKFNRERDFRMLEFVKHQTWACISNGNHYLKKILSRLLFKFKSTHSSQVKMDSHIKLQIIQSLPIPQFANFLFSNLRESCFWVRQVGNHLNVETREGPQFADIWPWVNGTLTHLKTVTHSQVFKDQFKLSAKIET